MKTKILLLFVGIACAVYALNPPANRPVAPSCSLRQAIEIAEAEVRKIDESYYCDHGMYQYAYMKPQSKDFQEDHWLLYFLRSDSGPKKDGTGYDDIEVRVSLDGRKTSVRKN